jgi:hypothetical protein
MRQPKRTCPHTPESLKFCRCEFRMLVPSRSHRIALSTLCARGNVRVRSPCLPGLRTLDIKLFCILHLQKLREDLHDLPRALALPDQRDNVFGAGTNQATSSASVRSLLDCFGSTTSPKTVPINCNDDSFTIVLLALAAARPTWPLPRGTS